MSSIFTAVQMTWWFEKLVDEDNNIWEFIEWKNITPGMWFRRNTEKHTGVSRKALTIPFQMQDGSWAIETL